MNLMSLKILNCCLQMTGKEQSFEEYINILCICVYRAIVFGTYLQSWAQGFALKNIDSQILPYLIVPSKTVPIYYNSTRTHELAILGGLCLFSLSKFLFTPTKHSISISIKHIS